jgi:hypothetical protein
MIRAFSAMLAAALVGALPARAADPLASLRFLVGTWSCSYQAGKTVAVYKATFAYDMNGNWIRERDAWKGGGADLGMLTYAAKSGWTFVVLEPERTTTIFRATGIDANHLVYRSVLPDASMTEVFDRVSPVRYTLHFTQMAGGKATSSVDICVKT